ncbi:MAG: stage III sporulation protein AB [Bacillota bacterium]
MMIKFLVSLVIILSSTAIGMLLSHRYTLRVKCLKSLHHAMQMLEVETLYASKPLPVAMKTIAERSYPSISVIFHKMHTLLLGRMGITVSEAWYQSVDQYAVDLPLNKEDIDVLKEFGKMLGTTDREYQEKNFHHLYFLLKKQEEDAVSQKCKNEKLYKSLGILTGIGIVIVLI